MVTVRRRVHGSVWSYMPTAYTGTSAAGRSGSAATVAATLKRAASVRWLASPSCVATSAPAAMASTAPATRPLCASTCATAAPAPKVSAPEWHEPRRHARREHRHEIPPRVDALVQLGGKALEVLLHEEEMPEFRVCRRHGDEPRRGDDEEKRQAREDAQAPHQRPVAPEQE